MSSGAGWANASDVIAHLCKVVTAHFIVVDPAPGAPLRIYWHRPVTLFSPAAYGAALVRLGYTVAGVAQAGPWFIATVYWPGTGLAQAHGRQ